MAKVKVIGFKGELFIVDETDPYIGEEVAEFETGIEAALYLIENQDDYWDSYVLIPHEEESLWG